MDYGKYYEISNYGRVRSKERIIWNSRGNGFYQHIKQKILKPYDANNGEGYITVRLYKDGKKTSKAVHLLVYMTFVGDIPEGMTINHKDGNKKNPRLDNLELVTYSENIKHAINVLHVNTKKPKYTYYVDDIYSSVRMTFDTAMDAAKYFDVSSMTIKGYATNHLKGIFKDEYIITRS